MSDNIPSAKEEEEACENKDENKSENKSENKDSQNSLDNEIQKDLENTISKFDVLKVVICVVIGLYMGITFFPIKFHPETLWVQFADGCCGIHHGTLRCPINNTCLNILIDWISLQNTTRNFYNECCYFYAPYTQYRFLSQLYCNPSCLNPKYF